MTNRIEKIDTPDKIELSGKNANEETELSESADFFAMETTLKGLFESLKLVGDSDKDSLEDILDNAITQGERFIEWKNSDRPLNNIQIFHKIDGELEPYKPSRSSFFKSFESAGNFEIKENSQLEIWECDKIGERYFPLQRIPLSKFCDGEKAFINEELRDRCLLRMKLHRQGSSISFSFTIDPLKQEISLDKRTELSVYDRFKNFLQRKIPAASYAYAFCFVLIFFSVSINIAYAEEANIAQEARSSDINRYKDTKFWTFILSNTEQIRPSGGV